MKHQILNRWTGGVLFECEVPEIVPPEKAMAYTIIEALRAKCTIAGADLSSIDAGGIDFTGADLRGADFTHAVLPGANFTGVNAPGADFVDATLSGANFTGAYLANSDFTGAYLGQVNFTGTCLISAIFACAFLGGAVLTNANIRRAVLAGTDLEDVCFSNTIWAENVTISERPIYIDGLRWQVVILDEHMQIGCELHLLAEWLAFSDRRIAKMSGCSALRFWRTHKDALLTMARAAGRSFEPVANKGE